MNRTVVLYVHLRALHRACVLPPCSRHHIHTCARKLAVFMALVSPQSKITVVFVRFLAVSNLPAVFQ